MTNFFTYFETRYPQLSKIVYIIAIIILLALAGLIDGTDGHFEY